MCFAPLGLLCDAACTQADVRRRLTGPLWMVAVAESVPIRVFSEERMSLFVVVLAWSGRGLWR